MGTCIFVTEFLYFSMFEIVHKNGDTQEQINTSIDKRERRKGKQVGPQYSGDRGSTGSLSAPGGSQARA